MPDFTFDGPNKLIVEPAGAGNTSFDVERDLYSAWKRWVQSGVGAQYLNAFIVEGGTPIGATGQFTGSTILLTNGWKIRAAEHDHQLTLLGNLFSDDGVVAVPSLTASATVFVSASVSAQGVASQSVTEGSGGLCAQNITAIIPRQKRIIVHIPGTDTPRPRIPAHISAQIPQCGLPYRLDTTVKARIGC